MGPLVPRVVSRGVAEVAAVQPQQALMALVVQEETVAAQPFIVRLMAIPLEDEVAQEAMRLGTVE